MAEKKNVISNTFGVLKGGEDTITLDEARAVLILGVGATFIGTGIATRARAEAGKPAILKYVL